MKTMADFDRLLPDEDACKRMLVEMRWPHGVICPRCKSTRVFELKSRPFHWVCKSGKQSTNPDGNRVVCAKNGGYRFSVITGTIFQDTKKPLKLWFKIAYLMLTAKKGISALQVHRVIFGETSGHDYRTSWYICMRLRSAMAGEIVPPLGDDGLETEADETWIGGKEKNKHWADKHTNKFKLGRRGGSGKIQVIGAIARKGNVVCKAVNEMGFDTLNEFVRETVSTRTRLISTDENPQYRHLGAHGFVHKRVNHSEKTYVVGSTHTNSIESFWSLLKRGIMGSYHHVSRDYLPLYLNEFQFRFNNRKNPQMFEALLQTV